jgi:uncharacterized membrane protein YwaF
MNFNLLKDDSNIDNFLMANYMYNNFDEAEIKTSLDLLRPDNMWGYYQSKLVGEEQKKNPEKF